MPAIWAKTRQKAFSSRPRENAPKKMNKKIRLFLKLNSLNASYSSHAAMEGGFKNNDNAQNTKHKLLWGAKISKPIFIFGHSCEFLWRWNVMWRKGICWTTNKLQLAIKNIPIQFVYKYHFCVTKSMHKV